MEKEEKESLAAENQKKLPNQDLHVQDFRYDDHHLKLYLCLTLIVPSRKNSQVLEE